MRTSSDLKEWKDAIVLSSERQLSSHVHIPKSDKIFFSSVCTTLSELCSHHITCIWDTPPTHLARAETLYQRIRDRSVGTGV